MDRKEWTIMVYLAGDNNLSVDMAHAMEQIKGVAGEEANGTNLFVYYDGNSAQIPTLYCDFSDSANPKHVRSFKVPNKLYRVEPKRNENAADYRSILNFVDWCLNKVEVVTGDTVRRGRRADKYGLIFSGHSLGFNDAGLFRDETAGKALTMEDMFLLIDRLTSSEDDLAGEVHEMDLEYEKYRRFEADPDADRRRSTVLVGQPLDILGFDSCVMGMLEVGYQFKTSAKTVIASEGSVPSAGWTYAKILGSLARDFTPLDDNEVAARFVTQFIKSQDSFTVGGASVDMAAWDMAKLGGLNTELEKLADLLLECFKDRKSAVYRNMERVVLQVHWKCQSYMHDQNVDIGDFCELLRDECASLARDLNSEDGVILGKLQEACDSVLGELNNVVILSGFSGGEYQYSNGISLFFPWSYVTYMACEKNYKRLEFVREGAGRSWSQFLHKYLGEVTLRQFEDPEVSIPEHRLAAASGVGAVTPSIQTSKHRYQSFRYNEDERSLGLGGQVESKLADENGSKLAGERGSKLAGEAGSKLAGEAGSKLAGEGGSKLAGEGGSKLAGEGGSKLAGEAGSKLAGERGSKLAGESGSKLAGEGGSKLAGERGSKLAGERGSKLAGEAGSKLAGEAGSKLAGERGSKLAGEAGSKLAGEAGSKLAGERGSKLAGEGGSKLAGESGSKLAGEGGSKLAGESGSKLAGESGSKLAGEGGSKLAGESGSKLAGEGGSKLAGERDSKLAGGGTSTALFSSLRLYKNIESRWNISGFTKKPAESDSDGESADATHG